MSCYAVDLVFRESSLDLNVMEKFSTRNIVHDEVDSIVFLEYVVHINDKRVLFVQHNKFFKFS